MSLPRQWDGSATRREASSSLGYFSRHIAEIFAAQRDEIIPPATTSQTRWDAMSVSTWFFARTPVVIIFDLRRYEVAAQELVASQRADLLPLPSQLNSLIDNDRSSLVRGLTGGYYFDRREGVQLTVRKLRGTTGRWGTKDGGKDHHSAVNETLDIGPVTVTVAISRS